jgi:hypothetical protein
MCGAMTFLRKVVPGTTCKSEVYIMCCSLTCLEKVVLGTTCMRCLLCVWLTDLFTESCSGNNLDVYVPTESCSGNNLRRRLRTREVGKTYR